MFSISFKHLPLSLTDFSSTSDFDYKSSSAEFEGNSRAWWAKLNLGYSNSFLRASNFRSCTVRLHVLPQPEAKVSEDIFGTSHAFRYRQHCQF